MNPHRSGARACAQIPDDLVRAVERAHAVLADPNVPTWRRHEALADLAAAAYFTGRDAGEHEAAQRVVPIDSPATPAIVVADAQAPAADRIVAVLVLADDGGALLVGRARA